MYNTVRPLHARSGSHASSAGPELTRGGWRGQTGYVAADIGQCGQHCAEKLQAEAHARAAGEEGAQAEQRAQDRALRVEEGPPSLSGSQHAQADSGST
eukprot:1516307-Rhodomonas_salina.1